MSETPATRAYRVAYDGRPFHGFQRQPDVSTVENAIFDALRELGVLDDADKPEGYAAAGRTDAGVSARAQTVAFEAPEWLTPRAFNSELPASVRAWASADVASGFHATHDAVSRAYRYHLYAPRDGDQRALDEGPIRAALGRLAGEHDFHNLTPDETGTVRDLTTTVERDGDFLVVGLEAGGFARQLVRRVVGLAVEVGRGESPVERVDRVLGEGIVEGPEGVAPAAPYPLVLWYVTYPDIEFSVDEDGVASAREIFGDRCVEFSTRGRVAGAIRESLE